MEQRSHLFVFVKNRSEPIRIALGLSASYVPHTILKESAGSDDWGLTADVLAALDSVAKRADVPTLFVLLPERYQVDEELFASHARAFNVDLSKVDIDQPTRRLAEEMRERGLDVIDALDAFRQAHRLGIQLYGSVDPHLTPAGHETLYDVVAPALSALLDRDPTLASR